MSPTLHEACSIYATSVVSRRGVLDTKLPARDLHVAREESTSMLCGRAIADRHRATGEHELIRVQRASMLAGSTALHLNFAPGAVKVTAVDGPSRSASGTLLQEKSSPALEDAESGCTLQLVEEVGAGGAAPLGPAPEAGDDRAAARKGQVLSSQSVGGSYSRLDRTSAAIFAKKVAARASKVEGTSVHRSGAPQASEQAIRDVVNTPVD
mmetsp:Transcript_54642/g.130518  ORF Transcript_54642/g.130518 Transcript_54642/m.130518 type:complete len:210 (-) Transcript_54642:722-1351(-)